MDLDKSLDDLIPKKAPGRGRGGGRGGDRQPRVSRDRQAAEPYSRPPPRSTEDQWVHDAYDGPKRNNARDTRRRDPVAAPAFVGASPRIFVSGIHYEVTADDLKTIFSQAGTIVQGPTIHYDRSGRSTGNSTIEFASAQQAKSAINMFDGAMTKGQTISIKLIAPPRPVIQKQASGSLLNRLAGGNLQERLGGGSPRTAQAPRGAARGRGVERGRGGRGARPPRPARRGPATAEDLDAQLAAYGKTDAGGDVAME